MDICKTSKKLSQVLFWVLVVLVIGCVSTAVYQQVAAESSAAWRYSATALAAAAILVGHHASFATRCHGAKVYAAISDTLTLIGLVVLIVLLVRYPSPQSSATMG